MLRILEQALLCRSGIYPKALGESAPAFITLLLLPTSAKRLQHSVITDILTDHSPRWMTLHASCRFHIEITGGSLPGDI